MTSQVEGTNDSSCLSKFSAVSRNYFKDEFLSFFISKRARRAPLIHLGYAVRAAIVNSLMEEFISKNFRKQVVSVGAGFDTLFFKSRSKNTEPNLVYYELDLSGVVKRKITCIQRSETLSQLIGQYSVTDSELISSNYCLLAVDLQNIAAVRALLAQHLDSELPTLFLSECAITYLEEKRSTELIQFASEFLNATFVTYEQIHPEDVFGQVMVGHFASLNSPLQSINCYPTLDAQRQRYINNRWQHCSVLSAQDAYHQVTSQEERRRVLRLEQFDEWEELYAKCCHYAVIVASQGTLAHWSTLCTFEQSLYVPGTLQRPTLKWTVMECEGGTRYGHSVIALESCLLLLCGYGVQRNGRHGRLKDVVSLECVGSTWKVLEKPDFSETEDSMFTTCTEFDSNRFITYGGRTAPSHCIRTIPAITTLAVSGEGNLTLTSEPLVSTFNAPARWKHTAIIGSRNHQATFVVFGGRTSNLELLNDTWMVSLEADPAKRTVETLPQGNAQPCPRFSHSAVVRKNSSGSEEMWMCGGISDDGPLADVWRLDLNSGEWTEVLVPGLLPRFGHAACCLQDRMLLVGGVNQLDSLQPGVAVVHLESLVCIEYQLPTMDPQRSMLFMNHCLVVSKDQESILIVGGGGNCFSFGTFLNKHIVKIKLKDLL